MAEHLNAIIHCQFDHIAQVADCSNMYTALHFSQGGAVQIAREFCGCLIAVTTENPDGGGIARVLPNRAMIPLDAGTGRGAVWLALVATEISTAASGREPGSPSSGKYSASAVPKAYSAV